MALVSLSMPEEVNTHPSPKVEEDMNRYGNRLQLTVKAQAVQSENNPLTDGNTYTALGWPSEVEE